MFGAKFEFFFTFSFKNKMIHRRNFSSFSSGNLSSAVKSAAAVASTTEAAVAASVAATAAEAVGLGVGLAGADEHGGDGEQDHEQGPQKFHPESQERRKL